MNEILHGQWPERDPAMAGRFDELWHRLAPREGHPNMGLTQRKNEITRLWEIFYARQPRVILEIGVSQGGTFASWCVLGPADATLIGIDRDVNDCRPRPGEPVPSIPPLDNRPLKMTQQGGGMHSLKQHRKQTIVPINGWSYEKRTVEALERTLQGRKIDFLFHDASHAAAMFFEDFRLYYPFIADGGIAAFHDIAQSADPNCNKRDEWVRILKEENYSRWCEILPVSPQTEMGIGILWK